MIKRINQAGDTIIEVLIAITVVASVLAGAYTTVNHSLANARQSQERVQALKLAEGELEQLKSMAALGTNPIFGDPQTSAVLFCTSPSSPTTPIFFGTPTLPASQTDDFSIYPGACKDSSVPGNFNVSIRRVGNDFTLTVRWNNAIGQGNDELVLVYRIYP